MVDGNPEGVLSSRLCPPIARCAAEETIRREGEGGMPAWMSESEIPLPPAEPAEAMPDWLAVFGPAGNLRSRRGGWFRTKARRRSEEEQPVA